MEELDETKKSTTLITDQRNRLIFYIIIAMILNLILVPFAPGGTAKHLNGQSATQDEIVSSTIRTIFIGIPAIGFILGSVITLFPYKGLPYSKKYLYFSLAIILVLEIVILTLSAIVLIKHKFM